jgi:hypothetical protein
MKLIRLFFKIVELFFRAVLRVLGVPQEGYFTAGYINALILTAVSVGVIYAAYCLLLVFLQTLP